MPGKAEATPCGKSLVHATVIAYYLSVNDRECINQVIDVLLNNPRVAAALARVGVFVIDHEEETRSYNELHHRLGLESGIFLDAFDWLENVHPEDRPEVTRLWTLVLEGKRDTFQADFRFRQSDGSYRWISNKGTVVYRNEDGTPRLYVGADSDISELKQTQSQLSQMALHDPVLGVLNRRGLELQSGYVIASAIRRRAPVALLVVDLDDFKKINSAVGHAAADQILQRFVKGALSSVRKVDLIGRYGGDEFVVVLPDAKEDDAVLVGNRLISATRLIESSSLGFPVTISVGATAGYPAQDHTIGDFFRVADSCLFAAKDAGKDDVRFKAFEF